VGIGTQKLEEEVRKLLPDARVVRMDLDTVRQRAGHQIILDAFERREYDILLGTQMIAKGLDYPNVTLVGVLYADTGLFSGNYRGSETTFQLLTQVVGRSGRGEQAGHAIIQTFNPDHYAIQYASHHDYAGFYVAEMHYRHTGKYPPYRFLATVTFSARTLEFAEAYALRIKAFIMEQAAGKVEVLGPAQPYIAQVNRRFRLRLLLKYKEEAFALRLLNEVKKTTQTEKGIDVQFDVNPLGE
jgi:primosomal protein N' (replication factor Y)